jgi:hypothetical protein
VWSHLFVGRGLRLALGTDDPLGGKICPIALAPRAHVSHGASAPGHCRESGRDRHDLYEERLSRRGAEVKHADDARHFFLADPEPRAAGTGAAASAGAAAASIAASTGAAALPEPELADDPEPESDPGPTDDPDPEPGPIADPDPDPDPPPPGFLHAPTARTSAIATTIFFMRRTYHAAAIVAKKPPRSGTSVQVAVAKGAQIADH